MSDSDWTYDELAELLKRSPTIAVVGCSNDESKSAHQIPLQMQKAGFTIIPVNPRGGEMLGQKVYPTLADIPGPVDLVNVFRPSADAEGVTRQAADIGAKAVWLQQDIISDEARAIAKESGMTYVEDSCIAVVRRMTGVTQP